MNIKRYYILLILFLYGAGDIAYSQEKYIRHDKRVTDIEVHFKLDNYTLDLGYMGNDAALRRFAEITDSIGLSKIDSVIIVSQSSPEGPYERNQMLSENRAGTMRKYILDNHPELAERLCVQPDGESWGRLREYVEKDTLMDRATIDKVLSVIDADVSVGTKKWRMKQLPVYGYLHDTYYPIIRNSTFCILYYSETPIPSDTVIVVPEPVVEVVEEVPDTTVAVDTVVPEVEKWTRKLHLKTNAIGLGMGISNAAVEIDLAKHWSLTLPVYYSAWNYVKTTVKFRTFAVQPELRFWFSERNDGFFAGAHFGLAYYNFAFDGDYRYQDHNRETPAIGGGLSVGYRLPIGENRRWRVEFSAGAGYYPLHYDKFYNTPNTKEGLMIESIKETYLGIDQAAVTFAYTFDLKKKGGRR